jgi:hypothetical protein
MREQPVQFAGPEPQALTGTLVFGHDGGISMQFTNHATLAVGKVYRFELIEF